MTKDTYHRRYPLPDLCRGGRIEDSDMIAVSSGSTGRPSIWPCSLVVKLVLDGEVFSEEWRDLVGHRGRDDGPPPRLGGALRHGRRRCARQRDTAVGVDPRNGFEPVPGPELPFVFVFGRSLFAVSFFGANVYPENVAVGLEQPTVSDHVTGKFVLETVEDEDRDRRLRITVELAPGSTVDTASFTADVAESIRKQLLRTNSEYAHYVPVDRQLPQVDLRELGDPEYFPVGVKHRYTRPGPGT
jgi:phenylacetate-coenzyme A ligase PaaK-like adenylate-forming protein